MWDYISRISKNIWGFMGCLLLGFVLRMRRCFLEVLLGVVWVKMWGMVDCVCRKEM